MATYKAQLIIHNNATYSATANWFLEANEGTGTSWESYDSGTLNLIANGTETITREIDTSTYSFTNLRARVYMTKTNYDTSEVAIATATKPE